ncbi:1-alkyl-2-acetylglycerophosphocholine esterase [Parastagonospora nodorum]|nr:1-alkyl-2-acetylglycerophosphocholine esterase [Parastagonospora nodorum]KAH4962520.1 1-alkyl-2-acetylglycerophosphocholine esterase [Parastagonospora nodorum]KAH5025706.1 1-alkyl-2-acetylglycerophosphocholine esterase [Parastagonospora nodorum]KAH5097498.1 1-alkyl-2-acetylglycerophosphocholine esterase [Parastagonospora nodorum]KAH5117978.1 1-alkyl-2-acetylglycerophosphocholine esterase [Parastagonospora nodorum]
MSPKTTHLCIALSLFLSQFTTATVIPIVGSPPFDVSITTAALTDTDRLDPYAKDNRARTIMISSFNPIKVCHNKTVVPYMPPGTAAAQDEKYGAYGLPNGTFQSLQLSSCGNQENTHNACPASSLPIVLFSGALSTSRLIYTSMLQNIAAAGYLVISIDHPYDSDVVEFPDGGIATGTNIESDEELALALATRVADIAFVREQLSNTTVTNMLFPGQRKTKKVAAIGHSLGGAAAAAAMLNDHSISAGINLDGSFLGAVITAGLDRPFMLMGHENKTQETDPSWKAIWPKLTGRKKEFEVKKTAHYSFSDLPRIVDVLGFQDMLPAEVGEVLGTLEGGRMMDIVATYAVAFLDMVFKSGSGEVLEGEFPEVVIAE